jgi:AraC-like DNA-binding protein/quercetin dioxygenase-like cupin family protein
MADLRRMNTGRLQVQVISNDAPRRRPNRRHHHNVFEMLYILEGSTHIRIRRRKYVARVGDLVIYYPGEDHEEQVQPGPWTIFVLRFPQPRLGAGVSFPDKRRTPPVVALPWPERFQKLFELMLLDLKVSDSWTDIMSKAYLVQFAVLLRRALRSIQSGREVASERSARIEKAIDMIRESLNADLSLKELARRAFMSESSFSHVFKDLTGIPPKRYAIRTRIARAKELLETTDLSVKEIAVELGYEDPHYFSRAFKKVVGRPPTAFRNKSRKVHRLRKRVHLPRPPR